jgi:FlaA1/EpsC-like NDP-sugar epimerase
MLESFHIRTAQPVLVLPRYAKRVIALAVDAALCVLTVWLAFYLRLGEFISLAGPPLWVVGVSLGLALPIFIVSGLYRAIFRYSGWPALLAVMRAIVIYGLLFSSVFTAIGVVGVPRTVGQFKGPRTLLVGWHVSEPA